MRTVCIIDSELSFQPGILLAFIDPVETHYMRKIKNPQQLHVSRVFLGWDHACLPLARDYIVDTFAQKLQLDLRELILVLPLKRAARRLLELLLETAEERALHFIPPQFITLGDLPEKLYEQQEVPLSDTQRVLLWQEILTAMPKETLKALLEAPAKDEFYHWFLLAEKLAALSRELCAARLDLKDVLSGLERSGSHQDERWKIFFSLRDKYVQLVRERRLGDPDIERERALQNGALSFKGQIILIGTVDLNRITRDMLRASNAYISCLLHAPKEMDSMFDSLGCLLPEAWMDYRSSLSDEEITFAESTLDQSTAALASVSDFAKRFASDEITLGVVDDELKPAIKMQFQQAGLELRDAVGDSLRESPPYVF